jgi:hypothetical protein
MVGADLFLMKLLQQLGAEWYDSPIGHTDLRGLSRTHLVGSFNSVTDGV